MEALGARVASGVAQATNVRDSVRDRLAQASVLALELLEAPRLGDDQAPVLATPPVVGDVVDAQGLHNVGHLLALTEQDLGLTQLGDDLLGTVALLGDDLTSSSVAKPYTGGGPIPGVRVRAAIECRAV